MRRYGEIGVLKAHIDRIFDPGTRENVLFIFSAASQKGLYHTRSGAASAHAEFFKRASGKQPAELHEQLFRNTVRLIAPRIERLREDRP